MAVAQAERASLQLAGQYSDRPTTPLTEENAPEVGLDPARGFAAGGLAAPAQPPPPPAPGPIATQNGSQPPATPTPTPTPVSTQAQAPKPVWSPTQEGATAVTTADQGQNGQQPKAKAAWSPTEEGATEVKPPSTKQPVWDPTQEGATAVQKPIDTEALKDKSTDEQADSVYNQVTKDRNVSPDEGADVLYPILQQQKKEWAEGGRPGKLAEDITGAVGGTAKGLYHWQTGLRNLVNTVGGGADVVYNALGGIPFDDVEKDLRQKLADNPDALKAGLAKVAEARELRIRQTFMGVGVGQSAEDIQRQFDQEAQISNLLAQANPEFVKNHVQQALLEGVKGGALNVKQLQKIGDTLWGPTGWDPTTYFGNSSSLQALSKQELRDYLAHEQELDTSIAQSKEAKLSPIEQSVANAINHVAGHDAVTNDDLIKQGYGVRPEKSQQVADSLFLAETVLADRIPGLREALSGEELAEGALGLGSKASKAVATGASVALDKVKKWSGWEFVSHLPDIVGWAMHPTLGPVVTIGKDIAGAAAAKATQVIGNATAEVLESAAKNEYRGNPLWYQFAGRGAREVVKGGFKGVPYAALTSENPEQFGETVGGMAALHGLFKAPEIATKGLLGGTGDSLFVERESTANKPVQDIQYGVDPATGQAGTRLDSMSSGLAQNLDPPAQKLKPRYGLYTRVKQMMAPYADIYLVSPAEMRTQQSNFAHAGANTSTTPMGFAVDSASTGTGRAAVFVDPAHFDQAFLHEAVGHPAHWLMPPNMRQGLVDLVKSKNDPAAFTQRYNGLDYNSLPTTAEVNSGAKQPHPSGMTKDLMDQEMAAEQIGQFFNGKKIDDWTKDESAIRQMKNYVGTVLEKYGIPSTTWEANSNALGLQPSVTSYVMMKQWLRDLVENRHANAPTRVTGGAPPAGTPPGGAPPGGGGPPPGAGGGGIPPAAGGGGAVPHAAVQQRAYQIGQQRAAQNLPGDETSDWFQAEQQLRQEQSQTAPTRNVGVTGAGPSAEVQAATQPPEAQPTREPQLRTNAIEALQALKVPKTEAGQLIDAVPGETEEEIVRNALRRRTEAKAGRVWPPPAAPAPQIKLPPQAQQQQQPPAAPGPQTPEEEEALHGKVRELTNQGVPAGEAHARAQGKEPQTLQQKSAAQLPVTPQPSAQPSTPTPTITVSGQQQRQQQEARYKTSNNAYNFPDNAAVTTHGINRNVWANVMAEEGPEFGKDAGHDSVFGLWADKPNEGGAYQIARQHGAHSLEAYNAVIDTWTKTFLQQSKPWELKSPGMQELVIADSQHRGGAFARKILDQMGGSEAVNKMSPADAIARYSELRKSGWPGNNRPFPNGATDRVTRERSWAMQHANDIGSGATAADIAQIETGAGGGGGGKGKGTGEGGGGFGGGGGIGMSTRTATPEAPYTPSQSWAAIGRPPAAPSTGAEETAPTTLARSTYTPAEENVYSPATAYSMAQQQAGGLPPAAPGGGRSAAFMPKIRRTMGGIEPEQEEGEEGGPAVESTLGVPKIKGMQKLQPLLKPSTLSEALKQHAALLSPDDSRVAKQPDNMTKGEHFLAGDPVHDHLLGGLPGGNGGRQRQILGMAEQAIANKQPMHLSYISAPQEAAKYPTRATRAVQYDAHSPEARLMGTTQGQLVGHSMIPVSVGVSPAKKEGENHQGYIQGISTNVVENNWRHLNTKLAAMGQQTPYRKLGNKFYNDLQGYVENLNAGHRSTGEAYIPGTAEYPSRADVNYVPYPLKKPETDFLNTVINNTAAFAKRATGLRQLAKAGGTLITPEGETNPMRHQIEQQDPGWRERVLEPTIRSFKAGLVHDVHPSEEQMPATIRPGQEFRELTTSLGRTSPVGRPDVPISVGFMPAGGYVSPNVEEGTHIGGALKQMYSRFHRNARDFYQRVEDASRVGGKHGGQVTPALGNWIEPDGTHTAEASTLIHDPDDALPEMRLKNAIRGLYSGQKGTANFDFDKTGPDRLYDIDFPQANHSQVDKLIGQHNFPANTVYEGPNGTLRAHVIDPGGENRDAAIQLAQTAGAQNPEYHVGTAAFDGGDTRAEAAQAYRRIIGEGGIQTREGQGRGGYGGYAPGGEHPLQAHYEEAEDNYQRLAREHGWEHPGTEPSPFVPEPEERSAAFMPAPGGAKPSKQIQKTVGPRPSEPTQANLWDKIVTRLGEPIEGAIPMRPARDTKGNFKTDKVTGGPEYEKDDYDLTEAPLLARQKKNLGFDEKGQLNKAPKGTEDTTGQYGKDFDYLTPTDKLRLSHLDKISAVNTYADKLSQAYQGIQDQPDVMAGKGWYAEVRKLLQKHFPDHKDLVAQLFAATSARQGVKQNFNQAMHIFDQHLNGEYDRHIDLYKKARAMRDSGELRQHVLDNNLHGDGPEPTNENQAMAAYIAHHDILPKARHGAKFGMNSNQVLKVLAGTWAQDVGGPKTPNYAGNLSGKTLQATIDMWAARHMRRLGHDGLTNKPWLIQPGAETGVKNIDFALSQQAFRRAADKHGLSPDDLQAIMWFAEQKHWRENEWGGDVEAPDYRPMLKAFKGLHEYADISPKDKKAA